jgi:peptidoglycan biosynthesis protein MviN/MurJ (putative lipid II flippase)
MQAEFGFENLTCSNGSVDSCRGFDFANAIAAIIALYLIFSYLRKRGTIYPQGLRVTLAMIAALLGCGWLIYQAFNALGCQCT